MTPSLADLQRDKQPAVPVREQARAKVNLTLLVRGKRPDGYHELESLVVFADLCDELVFSPASEDTLRLEGPFAGAVDGENLVLKAKRAVAVWLKTEIHGEFRLQKNIPVAAGLGCGSSDAAAAIMALTKFYGGLPEAGEKKAKCRKNCAEVSGCLPPNPTSVGGLVLR